MKVTNGNFKLSALALAMAGAMVTMSAYADEQEAAALKRPTNSVELGVANVNVSGSAAKFGEYTGLNKTGGVAVGNISVRGGDAYDNKGGTSRWSLTGTDLGTSSRTLGATMGEQGAWNFSVGYDELTHSLSDSYQTPYVGVNGGNLFVLPASYTATPLTGNFGMIGNGTVLGTAYVGMTAAQIAALQNLDVSTTRKNTSVNAGIKLDRQWSLSFDVNHLDQKGSKLQGIGGYGATALNGVSGESIAILPMPTNYETDTFSVGLSWLGDKGNFSASYNASNFRDANDSMKFQTFMGATLMQSMTTAPSNTFSQLNLSGGYALAPTTKFAGSLSYARNEQDNTFVVPDPLTMQTPLTAAQTSLHGVVVTTHADARVTDQTTKQLTLSAGLKYDKRDNQTPSTVYDFLAISGGNRGTYPNTPLSNDKARLEFAGDYKIKSGQNFRVEFDHENIKRWCNSYGVNAIYAVGTNCVVATASSEDKLAASYKLRASDDVDFKLAYSWAKRNTDSDVNARGAFISTNGALLPLATNPPTNVGLNGGDYRGFYPYFDASRIEQALKATTNLQASEQLSFTLGAKITKDAYDSTYGVTQGTSWSVNADTNYAFADNGSFYGFVTSQHRERDLTDIARNTTTAVAATATALFVPAFATWSNHLADNDVSLGLGIKQGGLMGGKLEMAGDLAYTRGSTTYGTQFNYESATTVAGLTCASAVFLTCGDLPAIKSETAQFKLTGTYQLDKNSKLAVRYVYQRLLADDYYYNTYQLANTPAKVLPTNQQVGEYTANVVAVSYIHNF